MSIFLIRSLPNCVICIVVQRFRRCFLFCFPFKSLPYFSFSARCFFSIFIKRHCCSWLLFFFFCTFCLCLFFSFFIVFFVFLLFFYFIYVFVFVSFPFSETSRVFLVRSSYSLLTWLTMPFPGGTNLKASNAVWPQRRNW